MMLFHFSQANEGVFVCFPEKPVSAQAVKSQFGPDENCRKQNLTGIKIRQALFVLWYQNV